jgi:hypothetical protein
MAPARCAHRHNGPQSGARRGAANLLRRRVPRHLCAHAADGCRASAQPGGGARAMTPQRLAPQRGSTCAAPAGVKGSRSIVRVARGSKGRHRSRGGGQSRAAAAAEGVLARPAAAAARRAPGRALTCRPPPVPPSSPVHRASMDHRCDCFAGRPPVAAGAGCWVPQPSLSGSRGGALRGIERGRVFCRVLGPTGTPLLCLHAAVMGPAVPDAAGSSAPDTHQRPAGAGQDTLPHQASSAAPGSPSPAPSTTERPAPARTPPRRALLRTQQAAARRSSSSSRGAQRCPRPPPQRRRRRRRSLPAAVLAAGGRACRPQQAAQADQAPLCRRCVRPGARQRQGAVVRRPGGRRQAAGDMPNTRGGARALRTCQRGPGAGRRALPGLAGRSGRPACLPHPPLPRRWAVAEGPGDGGHVPRTHP